jgi:hypothetical protein
MLVSGSSRSHSAAAAAELHRSAASILIGLFSLDRSSGMKTTSALIVCSGCAFLLLMPASAHAESAVGESIEWVLAASDRVLVGKVIKVDNITDQDNKECQAITVAVSRTLKGAHTERETALLRPYINEGYAKQWRDEGIPLIFCLVKNDGKRVSVPPKKVAWVLRDNNNGPDAVLLGKSKHYWTGCIPVLTRDFEVLAEADVILRFVEGAVKARRNATTPQPHTLRVPGNTAVYKKLWSGSAVYLTVPVDEKLEALGERWCKSNSPFDRREGAKILRHFRNEKNIGLLKSLLTDPHTAESTLHRTVPGKTELELVYRKKEYYVRQVAFEALCKLGVKVDRPVLEELLEGHDEPDPKVEGRKLKR